MRNFAEDLQKAFRRKATQQRWNAIAQCRPQPLADWEVRLSVLPVSATTDPDNEQEPKFNQLITLVIDRRGSGTGNIRND